MTEPTSTEPAPSSPKTGLSPMAWIAIGCGVVILLAFVAFFALGAFVFQKGKQAAREVTGADSMEELVERLEQDPVRTAAETAIRLAPDLEIVETDDSAGVITFRNVETGETTTLDFEDIAAGRLGMSSEEGEFTIEAGGEAGGLRFSGPEGEARIGGSADLDDVPDWVHIYPRRTAASSAFRSVQGDTVSGLVTLTTETSPEAVVEHYREWFEEQGWEIRTETATNQGVIRHAGIIGQLASPERTLNVGVMEQAGEAQITINYTGKGD